MYIRKMTAFVIFCTAFFIIQVSADDVYFEQDHISSVPYSVFRNSKEIASIDHINKQDTQILLNNDSTFNSLKPYFIVNPKLGNGFESLSSKLSKRELNQQKYCGDETFIKTMDTNKPAKINFGPLVSNYESNSGINRIGRKNKMDSISNKFDRSSRYSEKDEVIRDSNIISGQNKLVGSNRLDKLNKSNELNEFNRFNEFGRFGESSGSSIMEGSDNIDSDFKKGVDDVGKINDFSETNKEGGLLFQGKSDEFTSNGGHSSLSHGYSPHGHPPHGPPPHGPPPHGPPPHGPPPNGPPSHGHPPHRHTQHNNPPHGHTQHKNPPNGHTQNKNLPRGHTQHNNSPHGYTQNNNSPHGHTQNKNPLRGHTQNKNPTRGHRQNKNSSNGRLNGSYGEGGENPTYSRPNRSKNGMNSLQLNNGIQINNESQSRTGQKFRKRPDEPHSRGFIQ